MANTFFQFKQFTVYQENSGMKVSTDACIQAAWLTNSLKETPLNILDIGAGTGVLGLMLKQKFAQSKLVCLEPDPLAFIDLSKNIKQSNWDYISLFNENLQNFKPESPFDIIICNPPYFNNQLNASDLHRNNARHDLNLNKLDLIKHVHTLLDENGKFCVMYPTTEWQEWLTIANQHAFIPTEILSVQATRKKAAYLNIGIFSKQKTITQYQHLLIQDGNQYTTEFKSLLKDYYLAF